MRKRQVVIKHTKKKKKKKSEGKERREEVKPDSAAVKPDPGGVATAVAEVSRARRTGCGREPGPVHRPAWTTQALSGLSPRWHHSLGAATQDSWGQGDGTDVHAACVLERAARERVQKQRPAQPERFPDP